MPRPLIADAHERITESPTVPVYNLLKLQIQANSPGNSVGKRRPRRVLLQLGSAEPARAHSVERSLYTHTCGCVCDDNVTLSTRAVSVHSASDAEDTTRWAAQVGRHAFEMVSKATKAGLTRDRNSGARTRPKVRLTVLLKVSSAEANAGSNDLLVGIRGCGKCQKNYLRDNRVIAGERSKRPRCLLPRCRLSSSSACTRAEGRDCSSPNEERELGLDRCETGRFLSDGM